MGYEGFDFGLRFTFSDSSNYPVVTECKSKSKIKVTKLAVSCHHCVPEIAVSSSNNTLTTAAQRHHQQHQHPTPTPPTTSNNDDNCTN